MTLSTETSLYILVVDDVPSICSLVAIILRDEGYQVGTAHNGQEALARIAEATPDLVLLDLQMPVMDGWELHRRLREQDCCAPVVFMTAGPQARVEAERHHADGYIAKPFDPDALVATVAQHVQSGRHGGVRELAGVAQSASRLRDAVQPSYSRPASP
jgi:two-component system sensor histidine kinase/response regulator